MEGESFGGPPPKRFQKQLSNIFPQQLNTSILYGPTVHQMSIIRLELGKYPWVRLTLTKPFRTTDL